MANAPIDPEVSAQTKTTWRYKRIDQIVFGPGNFPTFTGLLATADQRGSSVEGSQRSARRA